MLNKLIESIAIKLNQEFGDGFAIYSENVEQGLKEPCFFILLLTSNQRQIVRKRYFREHPFDIHYYPSTNDKNQEFLDVVDKLNDALEYITMDNNLIRGTKMNHEIVDDVLHFFVNYDLFIYKEPEASDPMEILTVESGLKG